MLIPKGDTQILADDDVLALTNDANRSELEKIFG
jgi:Trk K+ transport system NAD-binding subunit